MMRPAFSDMVVTFRGSSAFMVVIFGAFYFHDTRSEPSLLDTRLVFRYRGKSRAKAALWDLGVVFGSVLAAKHLGRAAACES